MRATRLTNPGVDLRTSVLAVLADWAAPATCHRCDYNGLATFRKFALDSAVVDYKKNCRKVETEILLKYSSWSPFALDLEKQSVNDRDYGYGGKIKMLYIEINRRGKTVNEKVVGKVNRNVERLTYLTWTIYVKDERKGSNTEPKWNLNR